jgi:hypothetical protein
MQNNLIALFMLIGFALSTQVSALIPYQVVARDGAGQPIANAPIVVRFTIHQADFNGEIEWQELQSLSTNSMGLFSAQLGRSAALANVYWNLHAWLQ